jgi:hypothetical protein
MLKKCISIVFYSSLVAVLYYCTDGAAPSSFVLHFSMKTYYSYNLREHHKEKHCFDALSNFFLTSLYDMM